MLKGNKGEWSEIYTFLKLLAEGKLYAADSDLNRIEDVYYPLIKILRSETSGNREYYCNTNIKIVDAPSGKVLLEISVEEFKEKSLLLLREIKKAKGRSFRVPEIESFLEKIKCTQLKASSGDKSDIHIVVHDMVTGLTPELGFSIKSRLGGKATLFNASGHTNFIYEIVGEHSNNLEIEEINRIDSKSKIMERVSAIESKGLRLEYHDMESEMFKLNLQVIDTALPQIVASIVLNYYRGRGKNLSDLLDIVKEENPCNFNQNLDHNFYEYKIKNFIRDVALGLVPSRPWKGQFDATGGYIVVKEDGDILCYHIYNHNEFQDYLLRYTELETPSSSRYKFGDIYKKDGGLFIKLNLQIRFK